MAKRALITGITGQDGSYLSELLLSKGYEVHGVIRRSSTSNTERIDHIFDPESKQYIHYGDLNEGIDNLLIDIKPDEIYNLAAMSHVRISFDIPVYTLDVNATGVCRILEGIRKICPTAKYYQASSSEMFGVTPPPQNEETKFHPVSPYGVAKLAAYWLTRCYRDGYGLFASNGILFNHECITEDTPIILKRNGLIEIIPAGDDIVPHPTNYKNEKQRTTLTDNRDWFIWDNNKWSKITCMTANYKKEDIYQINSRGAVFQTTKDHKIFIENDGVKEIETQKIKVKDKLKLSEKLPDVPNKVEVSKDLAKFLGILVAEGNISGSNYQVRFSNTDISFVNEVIQLWHKLTGGSYNLRKYKNTFKNSKEIYQVDLTCILVSYRKYLFDLVYTKKKYKKVPYIILNSNKEIQFEFLKGYYQGDGLKKENTACDYEFINISTNSSALALGLYWICKNVLDQRMILFTYEKDNKIYYRINLNSPYRTNTGKHLKKELNEVNKIYKKPYQGWVFDFATESGTFSAGVGLGWMHNSPRRGINFVTRKITRLACKIKLGLLNKIELGNLEAKRDWGHSKDYMRAIHMILQHDKPDDFVVSTGEAYSVREFAEEVFNQLGLDFYKYLVNNDSYKRPVEVPYLLGDSTKIRTVLGWKPEVTFKQLVKGMIDNDMREAENELRINP